MYPVVTGGRGGALGEGTREDLIRRRWILWV